VVVALVDYTFPVAEVVVATATAAVGEATVVGHTFPVAEVVVATATAAVGEATVVVASLLETTDSVAVALFVLSTCIILFAE